MCHKVARRSMRILDVGGGHAAVAGSNGSKEPLSAPSGTHIAKGSPDARRSILKAAVRFRVSTKSAIFALLSHREAV
jgi:hypothetical protein